MAPVAAKTDGFPKRDGVPLPHCSAVEFAEYDLGARVIGCAIDDGEANGPAHCIVEV